MGYATSDVEEAFEMIEAQLCGPAVDNAYNQAFNQSWAETGMSAVDGAGLASWAGQSYEGIQRAKTLFSSGTSLSLCLCHAHSSTLALTLFLSCFYSVTLTVSLSLSLCHSRSKSQYIWLNLTHTRFIFRHEATSKQCVRTNF